MSNTWSHNCDSTGQFSLIPLGQVCPTCGINNQVESLRHAGFMATPYIRPTVKVRRRLAALLLPKEKPKTTEYDKEFYDRHG